VAAMNKETLRAAPQSWPPALLPYRQPLTHHRVPTNVADLMTWRMADRLCSDHGPGPNLRCVCCELPFPCLGRRLGQAGIYLAETGELPPTQSSLDRKPSRRPASSAEFSVACLNHNNETHVVGGLLRLPNGNDYRVLQVQAGAQSGTFLLTGYEINSFEEGPTLKPYPLAWPPTSSDPAGMKTDMSAEPPNSWRTVSASRHHLACEEA
jgi:hypothetical protein